VYNGGCSKSESPALHRPEYPRSEARTVISSTLHDRPAGSPSEGIRKSTRTKPPVVLLFCTRWFPSAPGPDFVKSSRRAAARFHRGDSTYPNDLVPKGTSRLEIPFPGLAIATHLKREGIRPEIVDSHLEVSPRHRIEQHKDNILCVGIECQLPFSYAEASAVSGSLRSILPGTPLLWFGIASTVLAEQLCEEGLADIVVRGLPESTFFEAARVLAKGKSLRSVDGITYLDGSGEVIRNPDRRLAHGAPVRLPDYSILPEKYYAHGSGHITYRTSTGCGCQCQFCPYPLMYGREYIDLPPERVVDELGHLKQTYDLKSVTFNDQSLFEKRERVRKICEGLVRYGLDLNWRASGQINILYHYSDELYELLGRSGCNELHMGIESGSERLMKIQKKPFTREMILSTAERLERAGIRLVTNFMFGLPEETMEDFIATWELIHELREIQPDLGVVYNHYTCAPGTMLYERLEAEGRLEDYTPVRKDLDSWTRFTRDMGSPWFVNRYPRRMALYYHVIAFDENRMSSCLGNPMLRQMYPLLKRYALWRTAHQFYRFAPDYHLAEAYYRFRMARRWRRVHKMSTWK
jgi:radical SAM superfamily enzyme YgiQ (UPF0313 family)